jgi:hypothetical protein
VGKDERRSAVAVLLLLMMKMMAQVLKKRVHSVFGYVNSVQMAGKGWKEAEQAPWVVLYRELEADWNSSSNPKKLTTQGGGEEAEEHHQQQPHQQARLFFSSIHAGFTSMTEPYGASFLKC